MFLKIWRILSNSSTTHYEYLFLIWMMGAFIGLMTLTYMYPSWFFQENAFFLKAYMGTLIVCSVKYIILRLTMGFTEIEDK